MNHRPRSLTFCLRSWMVALAIWMIPMPAFSQELPLGYVGPGAGLGMMGALIAVVAFILLALLGPILYPIRLIRRWYRNRSTQEAANKGESSADVQSPS